MKFGEELIRVRRYLRDPKANIWGNDLLIGIWNEVQYDFQQQTGILEDIETISVPPRFGMSYMHDWEHEHASLPAYRCWRSQGNFYAYTARFEVQEHAGRESDVDEPGWAVMQPWEAWAALQSPQAPRFAFPDDFRATKAMYYDREPLRYETRRSLLNDPSWEIRDGEPIAYTRTDDVSNEFALYPRPSTIAWNDEAGSGMVTSVSGDTTGAEVGTITVRTGTVLSSDLGVAVEVLEADDNILLIYDVAPPEITSPGDDIIYPDYLVKYVRYGVLAHAYLVNNDGRVASLSAHWGRRYNAGVVAVNEYRRQRHKDRDYRLRTQGAPPRRMHRHPRLPDQYPSVNP